MNFWRYHQIARTCLLISNWSKLFLQNRPLQIGSQLECPVLGAVRLTDIRIERIGGRDILCYVLEGDSDDEKKPVIKLPVSRESRLLC